MLRGGRLQQAEALVHLAEVGRDDAEQPQRLPRPPVRADGAGLGQRPVQQFPRLVVPVAVGVRPAALHERLGLQVRPVPFLRQRRRLLGQRWDGVVLAAEEVPAALGQPGAGAVGRTQAVRREQFVEHCALLLAAALPVEHLFAGEQDLRTERWFARRQQVPRPLEQPQGVVVGEGAGRVPPRPHVPASGGHRRPGLLVVVRDGRRVLVGAVAARGHLLEPLGGQRVVGPPGRAEHALVGDVAHQRVPERELVTAGEGGVRPLEDHLALGEPHERRSAGRLGH